MQSCPCMRWKRTQMSVWTASMMWPMCSEPLAYGSAFVTRILRDMKLRSGKGPRLLHSGTSAFANRARAQGQTSALIFEGLEFRLADTLLVGLFARDHALIEQRLDGVIHGAHAVLAARLHRRLELVE